MTMRFAKMAGILLAGSVLLCVSKVPVHAQEVSAGVFSAISSYMDLSQIAQISETDMSLTQTGQTEDTTICGYSNLGIANVESNLNVRESADEAAELVGKLQKDAGCEILGKDGAWYQIQSGKVTGYVKAEYLLTDKAAREKAEEIMTTIATVTTVTLNVREEMNTECSVIAQMPQGEELHVLEEYEEWIKIDLDGNDGYVSKEYVEISTQLPKAQTMTELKYGQGVSDTRVSLVSYATQFVGNPYVWGGTSLTRGADCSGFVMSVFANYGVYLPHSSSAQSGCGTSVSAGDAQPGDLFFYGSGRGINHVAIYIGNGQIVHASSPTTGIKISNAFYRNPVKIVRVIN